MQDLSLHLLDIAQNSIRAGADHIELIIDENIQENRLILTIKDNGKGMSHEMLSQVLDPFVTTRTTRRVGLGLSLLNQNCLNAGGDLKVTSELGKGTQVDATMEYDHIDRLPLGDMASTMGILIQGNSDIDFTYEHRCGEKSFSLSTKEIKATLQSIPINQYEIIEWIKQYITIEIEKMHESI